MGSIVTFSDAVPFTPIEEIIALIEPQQDLHGYDSPWPAGGGKNKANLTGATGQTTYGLVTTFDYDNEIITISGESTSPATYAQYRFATFPNIQNGLNLKAFNLTSGPYVDALSWDETTQTVIIIIRGLSTGMSVNLKFQMVAYEGDTAPTAWTPFSNICPISGHTGLKIFHSGADTSDPDVLAINWQSEAGTVYGGTLDVTNGVLTVDRAINVIDGTQPIGENGIQAYGGMQVTYTPVPAKAFAERAATQNSGLASDKFSTSRAYISDLFELTGRATNANVYFNLPETVTTRAQAITWFTNNPTQLVYELAEPFTVQLTAQQLSTLYGINNIWADTGNVTVTYQSYLSTRLGRFVTIPYNPASLKQFNETFIIPKYPN